MRMISTLLAAALVLPQSLSPQHAAASTAPASIAERDKALSAVFADYWEQQLKDHPEMASELGDKRYDDQLSDYSVAGYNTRLDHERTILERLGALDTTGMAEQQLLSKDLLVRELVEDQEEARFRPWQLPINQFRGPHTSLPQLVGELSFDNEADYDHYIARLNKIPTAFSQITDDLMAGMDDHRVPPKYLLEKALVQVETLAAQKPEQSPFAQPVEKFPASIPQAKQAAIREQVLAAVTRQVLPAYTRLARFMKAQYVPAGRLEPGAWSLPDGDRYYAFRVRQSTTTELTPQQIHSLGEQQVAEDEAQMQGIAKKLGFADLAALRASIPNNPKLHPASADALLATYKGYVDAMRPRLPELFARLPKAPLEIRVVPPYIEKDQAAAYYQQGTPDGKRPGIFFVNTYNATQRSLTSVEAVAYHEALPGHHLQISIAQELDGLPEFRRHGYYTAYTEGWGLYSERLGKDVGFYTDPYSDYGRLEADIWRAIRLVVDTGVHSQHWSRQQMVDYFHAHSAIDDTNVQAEVDRYIAWPGQALGYKVGQLKFLELRARAQKALGPRFDLRAYEDEVLGAGALPMDVLDQRVNGWIASQQPAKAQ
jgi:uncharacterized protein (DUF885 family)